MSSVTSDYYFPLLLFFFNDTPTTEIYTLSLHDALPICCARCCAPLTAWRPVCPGIACARAPAARKCRRASWMRTPIRSEERRVGKECRSRWWAEDYKKKSREHSRRARDDDDE